MTSASQIQSWRRRVHRTLESGIGLEPLATAVNATIMAIILLSVVAFAASTVPSLDAVYGHWFTVFEWTAVAVFVVEYLLRLWSCVELPFHARQSPWRARLHYATRPMQLIDLAAILPALLQPMLAESFGALWTLRLFRFLKLARYSPALNHLGRVLAQERSALLGALLVMLTLVMFSATLMHLIEGTAQPDKFGTVPDAMWWAIVTLGTVGYGDVYPITPLGKLFAGVVIVLGLGVFAIPIGIIATGFSQETMRREFVITWSLVARVPLFAGLDAATVSQIMTLLYARVFDPGDVIVHVGEPGDTMYFIASGEVMVEGESANVRIGEGEFFGEMALLDHHARSHTVLAMAKTRCLLLDRDDLERLSRRHPDIMQRVREVARRRAASGSGAG